MKRNEYIIGIDEVGRGSLAGPVTVAAVMLSAKLKIKNLKLKIPLRDSKKMSPRQRELWFQYITHIAQTNTDDTQTNAEKSPRPSAFSPHQSVSSLTRSDAKRLLRGPRESAICYAVASVSPKVIDKIGISNAANLAASRATEKVIVNCKIANYKIFLDGGLYLKNIRVNPRSNPRLSASTIIKGDEKIPAIMLASIVAKATRDHFMLKLHKKYPQYGFNKHKGYGTKFHIKAIKKFGLSPIHRRSFKIKI
jgi:ribonuclease HII